MKNKILILIVCLLLVSGCSATYDVEIKNNKVIENFEFIETNSSRLNNQYAKYSIGEDGLILYRTAIENELNNETFSMIDIEKDKYKKKKLSGDGLGIKYNYIFTIDNYNKSSIVNRGYKYFNVLDGEEDTFIISTSDSIYTFENYEFLDDLTVHLKTNHKVKENNADRVDGYNYYWDINKSNYKDKKIYIELYKDKYIFNYDNMLVKIGIIFLSIAILLLIVIIFFRQKARKSNKI